MVRRFLLALVAVFALSSTAHASCTVTLGVSGATDATGWTTISPCTSGDTAGASNFVYVSDSTGSDVAACGTVASPCKTLRYAGSTTTVGTLGVGIRNGHPDWLLLKQGDTWTDQAFTAGSGFADGEWTYHGASCTLPLVAGAATACALMVVTSYDNATADPAGGNPRGTVEGARPIVKVSPVSTNQPDQFNNYIYDVIGFNSTSATIDYFAMTHIEFYDYKRDPNSVSFVVTPVTLNLDDAIILNSPANVIMLEGNKWSYFRQHRAIAYAGASGDSSIGIQNMYDRRNISAYAYSADPQTISDDGYQNINNLLIEENVSYHNGWSELVMSNQLTVGGIARAGDTITLTFTNSAYWASPVSITYTVPASPTLNTIANGLVSLINSTASLTSKNVSASYTTWNGESLFVYQWDTVNTNVKNTAITYSLSVGATETISYPPASANSKADVTKLFSRIVFNHNWYLHPSLLTSTSNINRNVSVRGSSTDRPGGGTIFNNFFGYSGGNLQLCEGGDTTSECPAGTISYNVTISPEGYTNDASPGSPAWGVQFLTAAGGQGAMNFSNNIVAHQIGGSNITGMNYNPGTTGWSGTGNIAANWAGGTAYDTTNQGTNTVATLSGGTVTAAPDQGSGCTATYSSGVGGATAATWTAPNRDLVCYDTSLGGAGSVDHFMTTWALNQSKQSWNYNYTAPAINSYIRAGFNMADPGNTTKGGKSWIGKFGQAGNDNIPVWTRQAANQ